MMRINIYYGGRGLIEDSTIYVMNKITEVLEELRVEVTRYNLYEEKNGISMLPKTLKECEGIVLATSVEWLGIGGLMQQFLDACWLYGDKEKISETYMVPIVIASTYGEKEAEYTLIKAWEMLGGLACVGLSAYVDDQVEFETNPNYALIIEKKAEALYRTISQKSKMLPSSTNAVRQNVLKNNAIDLTPQESEQLSMYVSDDTYVKKQKEDIEELAQIFKEMLGGANTDYDQEFIKNFKDNFHPVTDYAASFTIQITDTNRTLVIEVNNESLKCSYGQKEDADVVGKTTYDVLKNIVSGRMTFQRAFMSGDLTARGNFKTLRMFDTLFRFDVL